MTVIEEKSLNVITFSGKQEDWKYWEIKFLAQARRKGFKEILEGTIPIPKDDEKFDLTKPAEKEKLDICKNNKLAFKQNHWVSCFSSVACSILLNSHQEEGTGGCYGYHCFHL